MYRYLFFDLDDTLVKDNPVTGRSELLDSGLEKYKELVKDSPNAIKILLTNRESKEIKYPEVYVFDEVVGKDNMEEYIEKHIHNIDYSKLFSLRKFYLFIRGISLYKRKQTPKLLYIFLRGEMENDKIYVLDDDKRVSGMFCK